MASFLIIANTSDATAYLSKEFERLHISHFDQVRIEPDGSLGIEEVRKLQKQALFKPYQSPQKAIILFTAEALTPQAQNALLKTLEEPPAQTLIYLISEDQEAFLPTILSRCTIISLQSKTTALGDEHALEQTLEALFTGSVGDRLYQAQLIGTKDLAAPWLVHASTYLREQLLTNQLPRENEVLIAILEAFQEAYTVITSTNVSPRLTMENLFLTLPQ